MPALSSPRMTDTIENPHKRAFPVAANAKLWQGAFAMMVAGLATPGAAVANAVALGRSEYTVDNTGGAASAVTAIVRRGTFKWDNAAADAIPASQVGQNCYILDDHTVAATSGSNTRSVAGRVYQVDPDGVWVETL